MKIIFKLSNNCIMVNHQVKSSYSFPFDNSLQFGFSVNNLNLCYSKTPLCASERGFAITSPTMKFAPATIFSF